MLKYMAGIITGTALTIIGWQRAVVAIVTLVRTILTEVGCI